jgi:hypothetical protein
MTVETSRITPALLTIIRDFAREEPDPAKWEKWAEDRIRQRPEVFLKFTEESLKLTAKHLVLFCLGETSKFNMFINQ